MEGGRKVKKMWKRVGVDWRNFGQKDLDKAKGELTFLLNQNQKE